MELSISGHSDGIINRATIEGWSLTTLIFLESVTQTRNGRSKKNEAFARSGLDAS